MFRVARPMRKTRRLSIAFVSICLLALTACGGESATVGSSKDPVGAPTDANAADWQKIVDAAKGEGSVVVYSSTVGTNETFKEFEKAYPGISIKVERAPTADLVARLQQEISVGAKGADVVFHADHSWFAANASSGALGEMKISPEVKQVGWDQHLNDNGIVALATSPWLIAYNTKNAKPIKSVSELLDLPRSTKVGINDAHGSVAATFQFDVWLRAFGPDFMKRLSEFKPKVQGSMVPAVQSVSAGELDYAFPVVSGVVGPLKAQGAPVDQILPEDALTGPTYYLGVLRSAPHPNAAQVFTNWLMSKQGLELMVERHAPISLPISIPGAIPWGQVQTYDNAEWTQQYWDEWLKKQWSPYVG